MKNTITITVEQYKCLRGHLDAIEEILSGTGMVGGLVIKSKIPKPIPKETKAQRVERYKKLIESGHRAKKPDHLKRK